jgi:hypothetical protein
VVSYVPESSKGTPGTDDVLKEYAEYIKCVVAHIVWRAVQTTGQEVANRLADMQRVGKYGIRDG